MSLTLFLPFFLLFAIYAWRGERQWVFATIFGCFFEAASPLLVNAGGRVTGLQTVYMLLPIGFMHSYAGIMRRSRVSALSGSKDQQTQTSYLDRADALMIFVTIIGVAGAVILPRLFNGQFNVTPSTTGLIAQPLRPSGKNYIQATYMVANAVLYFLLSRSLGRGVITMNDCVRMLRISTFIVAGLGIYQVLGSFIPLPWPSGIINSNLAYSQLYDQGAFGMRRMSSTYTETSVFSMHFVALFALFGLGLKRIAFGGMILLCLLISTSATAYTGLAILTLTYLALWGKSLTSRVLLIALCGTAVAIAVIFGTQLGLESLSVGKLVAAKLHSHSGTYRSSADLINLRAFVHSMGLGVGIGSSRASSFLVTFLACTGVPGLLCLSGFLFVLIRKGIQSASNEMNALALGCLGFIGAWIVSIPDLTMTLIWVMCAMLRAGSQQKKAEEAVAQPVCPYGVSKIIAISGPFEA